MVLYERKEAVVGRGVVFIASGGEARGSNTLLFVFCWVILGYIFVGLPALTRLVTAVYHGI